VAPSGLAFDAQTGSLTWTDNSLSETAFFVEKSTDGVNWIPVGQIDRVLTDLNTTGSIVSLVDLTWVNGDQYRVVAQNTVGDTWDYADPALNEIPVGSYAFPVVTTKSAYAYVTVVVSPPLAPSDLSATNVAQTSLTLNWVDNSNNEDGFTVEMADIADFSTILNTFPVGAGVTSLPVTGLTAETTYYFRASAFNVAGASAWSVPLAVTTLPVPPPTVPLAPSGLSATNVAQTSLTLNWVDNSNNEDGFTVEMADIADFSTVLNTFPVGAGVTSLPVTGLTPSTMYYFRVEAFNVAGPSGWSETLPVTTLVPAPIAPSGLPATDVTQTSLTLNWTDNSLDETGFNIQMATDIGFTANLQTLPAGMNATSLPVTGLTPSTTYYFRVEAFNAGGTSGWSVPLTVTTLAPVTPPLAPSAMTTANNTLTSITLNWMDNSNNEEGFTVQIATNNAFTNGLQSVNVGTNVTSWDFTGLTSNTKYYFRVRAFNTAGTSAWAPPINDKTLR
jgi:titin